MSKENCKSGEQMDPSIPASPTPLLAKVKRPSHPKAEGQPQNAPACYYCRIKKIKCDRRVPTCANCRRNSVECTYSDKGKRVNQTSTVLNNLDTIQSRLGFIEGVLSNVLATSEKPVQHSETSSQAVLDTVDGDLDSEDSECDPYSLPGPALTQIQISPTCEWPDLGKLHTSGLLISFGFQTYYILSRRVAANFHPKTPAQANLKEEFLEYRNQVFQKLLGSLSPLNGVDYLQTVNMVALPPRSLVESVFGTFFRDLNPMTPLFRLESFRELIAKTYRTSTESRDAASVVCISNMVLEVLRAKDTMDISGLGISDVDSILLKNARNALAITKDFLTPCLVNVQALLSLCIIAHQNFQIGVAEVILEQACQVAKMMGLNRERQVPPILSPADAEEHSNVFWTLFIMDKQISFLMGNSCRLPSYDCNAPFPEDEHFQRYLAPRIGLARIQEQIYFDLYSAKAHSRSPTDRHQRGMKICKSLERWYQANEEILTGKASECDADWNLNASLRLILNFGYHNARIMASRASTDIQSIKLRLEDARMGFKLLLSIRTSSEITSKPKLFKQVLHYHPIVEFFEIFKDTLTYPLRSSYHEDIALLHDVIEILRDLGGNSEHSSTYNSQLLKVTLAYIELGAKFMEFVDLNNSTDWDLETRPVHLISDSSLLSNPLTPTQLNHEATMFSESENAFVSVSADSMCIDDTPLRPQMTEEGQQPDNEASIDSDPNLFCAGSTPDFLSAWHPIGRSWE